MARNDYERSPRQRTEWFGGRRILTLDTSDTNAGLASNSRILSHPARLQVGGVNAADMAFPAGIVRGESCSIARFIADVAIYDVDRRIQNVSYDIGMGFVKLPVEDNLIADPGSEDLEDAPDPLVDLRSSYIWHHQEQWNPVAAGASFNAVSFNVPIDSTNSRVFESNEVLLWTVQVRSLLNTGTTITSVNLRFNILWRCLLRLD